MARYRSGKLLIMLDGAGSITLVRRGRDGVVAPDKREASRNDLSSQPRMDKDRGPWDHLPSPSSQGPRRGRGSPELAPGSYGCRQLDAQSGGCAHGRPCPAFPGLHLWLQRPKPGEGRGLAAGGPQPDWSFDPSVPGARPQI